MKKGNLARSSNFELLRIISIIMIITLHYLEYYALPHANIGTLNYYIIHFIESVCIMGVNCFVLITGYFLINKDKVNIRKIIDLLLMVAFYGFIFYFMMMFINKSEFNIKEFIKAIIPFLAGKRWFVRTYMILFLIAPYINKSLITLSKKSFQILIIILMIFFSIWPSFVPYPPVDDFGYGIINFIVLYVIGAYIKLHFKNNKNIVIDLIIYIICIISTYLFSLYYGPSWGYNFITNICGSIILFIIFSKLKIKSYKINYIASFVFGIYIVHCDFQTQDLVFNKLLKCKLYSNSQFLIPHMLFSIIILFIISLIIDIIRKQIFRKTIDPLTSNIKVLNKYIG
nr:acyltransferase family protein [uncultured Intestinibacter sp.]